MATARLPQDFKEFLKLLEDENVRYLLIGGFAVGYYGYPRATADMDVWIEVSQENAQGTVNALRRFGMDVPGLSAELFLETDKIIRMGVPPLRIEVHTGISGAEFGDCYARRQRADFDGIPLNMIGIDDLKRNKRASGRRTDLNDLEHLP